MPNKETGSRNSTAGPKPPTKDELKKAYDELAAFLLKMYKNNRLQNDSNKI